MTTIAQERTKLTAVGYRLRRREEWGSRFNYTTSRPVTEPARTQHVHITITNPDNYRSNDRHAQAVEAIGVSRFPATGISYNRLFMPDGSAYEGQPMGRRGAHTVNDFRRSRCITDGCPGRGGSLEAPSWNNNITGRAYVLCMNVDDAVSLDVVDEMARAMAADRLAGLVARDAEIHGHRCCSSKSCPGNRMWAWMTKLAQLVTHYLRVGLGVAPDQEDDDMPDKATFQQWVANGVQIAVEKSDPVRKAIGDIVSKAITNSTEIKYLRTQNRSIAGAVVALARGVELTPEELQAVVDAASGK